MSLIPWYYKAGAGLVLCGALYAVEAYRMHAAIKRADHTGYQRAAAEDAKALADWQVKYDKQVKADEDRLNAANLAHEKELGQVAAHAAALPVRHLVCKSAPSGGSELPAASHLPAGEAASPGLLAGSDGQDFDPGPNLKDYATDVEYLTVSCRQLMMAVHGFPSTP